jgi:ATP-binding cassette, subfamily B, bacterial
MENAPPVPPPRPPGAAQRLKASVLRSRQTLKLVWRSSPLGTSALGVLTVLTALLLPLVAFVGKFIVDAVVAKDAGRAIRMVFLEMMVVAALALLERGLGLVRQLVGARLGIDVNVAILEKAEALELRHFEDAEFYDKLTRARREASLRPLSLIESNFQVLRHSLTLAGYVALLVHFSGFMVAILLLGTIPAFLAESKFSAAAFRMRNWRSPDTRRLLYLEYVLGNDEHAKEVKLFGLGPTLLGRYRSLAERFYGEDRSLALRRSGWGFSLSLVSTLVFYGCYAFIVGRTVQGQLSLGDMTLYLVAFRQGQQSFQSVLGAVGSMYEDSLYMANLFEYLAIPTGRSRPASKIEAGTEQGVRFEDVGFRYPGGDRFAVRGINLFIPKGQSLALVGENGAGKTTLIKLLSGLYEPTEGRILLDGRDLRAWDEPALRRRIGVIFQDFNQYQLALRENVAFGSVEHLTDEQRLAQAIDDGGARELVLGLAAGLDTQLGRWFKEGVDLSGGQWQKVALARAFMRAEADILILDEPTAALDAEAEHNVFQRFRSLAHGRTTLLISHRFPTVRMADRILVLKEGQIVEEGTHAELLAAGARYARLFRLQAEGYR